MDIHLPHVLCSMIGQLRTCSRQLEIDIGRYACTSLEEIICHWVMREQILKNTMFATVLFFNEIREKYHCLFNQGFNQGLSSTYKAIISRHCRCFPCFWDLSILDQPMLEIFQRKIINHLTWKSYMHRQWHSLVISIFYLVTFILVWC